MGTVVERTAFVLGEPWIFLVIVICMGLLAYVHNMYPARFDKLFKATFNERMTRQVMREEMVFSHRASWLLLFVSACSFALICTLFVKWNGTSIWLLPSVFMVTVAALSLFIIVRQGLRTLLSVMVDAESGLMEFNFVSALIYKTLGFILLPSALVLAFVSKSLALYIFIAILVLSVFTSGFRLYRGWKIGRHYKASKMYMIFYLCALELIPTLVLIRLLLSNVQI